ncbi:MAG: MBL fold metallo-hydrolase [Oscillibacter sp.]|jgi:hydroxyacylglutathione hydrolase|nr:MBL fold metallo-hydrolase [uncultured Oscillibacter sp.]MCI8812049.1 MBL fold metallo-hydrolase [Oscillibacter sp.]
MKVRIMQVGPIGTNCYILEDESTHQAAVIDPGGDAPRLLTALKGLDVRYILLTHGHYDHTGAAAELSAAFPKAEVYIHEKDYRDVDPSLFPLHTELSGVHFYGEGDRLVLGTLALEVLHTPGHSEGSVTLRCGDILFCGDTLFAGSCGRTDFPDGDTAKLLASLRRLGELEGDLRVLPGHMEDSTLSRERQTNPYLRQAMSGGI